MSDPVPVNLPAEFEAVYSYRDSDGKEYARVYRYPDRCPGRKADPYRLDGEAWVHRAPEKRWPYRVETLNGDGRTVLIVEGEKCADAAAGKLKEDWDVLSWMGGTGAVHKTDWVCLEARHVILWPDADDSETGLKAMTKLAGIASKAKAASVQMIKPEPERDTDDVKAWDVANAIEEGVDVVAYIEQADYIELGEPESDPLDNLIEKTKTDAGAAFEPDVLERLVEMKQKDLSGFARIREKLKEAGVSMALLEDGLKQTHGGRDGDDLQGSEIKYSEADPWPDSVNGASLLDEMSGLISQYVYLPKPMADAVALWCLTTWIHDRLEISTFLNVTSATKRCGKSLLMEILAELVRHPLPASGRVTPAAIFRIIEKQGPTLLLDEADTFFGDDPELRGIVNGSQRRGQAYVLRCVGENHETRNFVTWCPKAISGIGGLPDTVIDRALVLSLERKPPSDRSVGRWRDRDKEAIKDLQRRIARWINDTGGAILELRDSVRFPPCLNDRARDAWEALLAISDEAGGHWAGEGGRAWTACEAVRAEAEDETGAREKLLADLREVSKAAGDPEALPTKQILEELIAMEGRPWSEYKRGKPLSPRGLSGLLNPFKVRPGTIRTDEGTSRGYKRKDLERVWKSYPSNGGVVSNTATQINKNSNLGAFLSDTEDCVASDTIAPNSIKNNDCVVVSDTIPPLKGKEDQEALDEAFEERAAIQEYDGGLPREEAEARAAAGQAPLR